jgi:carboxypeptidase Q
MTAPRYMPLLAYAEAWSRSTSGVVTGTPVYVGDSTVDEIDAVGSRLHHAIVLAARPQTEFLSKDRQEPSQGDGPVRTGNPPFPGPSSRVPQRELLARLRKYGAGVALTPSATLHGTVRVQGNPATAPDAVPTLTVAAEQYNMLVRLVKASAPVELRIEVVSRSNQDRLDSDNVIAEIPGTTQGRSSSPGRTPGLVAHSHWRHGQCGRSLRDDGGDARFDGAPCPPATDHPRRALGRRGTGHDRISVVGGAAS